MLIFQSKSKYPQNICIWKRYSGASWELEFFPHVPQSPLWADLPCQATSPMMQPCGASCEMWSAQGAWSTQQNGGMIHRNLGESPPPHFHLNGCFQIKYLSF